MVQYQSLSLLNTRSYKDRWTPSGFAFPSPTSFASEHEFEQFELAIAPSLVNGGGTEVPITPPIFRTLLQREQLKMIPREIAFSNVCTLPNNMNYDPDKPRDMYVCLGQNAEFVEVADWAETGYHPVGNDGDGYSVSRSGQINFPRTYYVAKDGIVISCSREYVNKKIAKKTLQEGTGDIIGVRSVPYGVIRKDTKHTFLRRTYKILKCNNESQKSGKRTVRFFDEKANDTSIWMGVGVVVLGTFVGDRPDGGKFIVQHDGERWDDSLESIRWIPYDENYLRENIDPK